MNDTMIKAVSVSVVALLLVGCGGTWSNSDLVFMRALPDRTELKSKIPTTETTSSPLERDDVHQRRDPLEVGAASTAYADAKKASNDFNTMLDTLLGILDDVRQFPPTTKTEDSRIWGPFADSNNPGFDVQVTIRNETDAVYTWKVELHERKSGDVLTLIDGRYNATTNVKEGQGSISIPVKDFKDRIKVDDGMKKLDQVTINYATDALPKRVEMILTSTPGSGSEYDVVGYTYREQADQSGEIRYQLKSASAEATVAQLKSQWLPSGEGTSVFLVIEGTYAGASRTECWDSAFKVSYFHEGWLGGMTSGMASNCVAVPGFE